MSSIEKLYPERSFELVHKRLTQVNGKLMRIETAAGFYQTPEAHAARRILVF